MLHVQTLARGNKNREVRKPTEHWTGGPRRRNGNQELWTYGILCPLGRTAMDELKKDIRSAIRNLAASPGDPREALSDIKEEIEVLISQINLMRSEPAQEG